MTSHYDTARDAWEEAGKLVQGPRRETHGDFKKNFAAIATLWEGYLSAKQAPYSVPISPEDVAHMMVLLKIARTVNGGHNPDDHVDAIGYAMIAAGLAEERK